MARSYINNPSEDLITDSGAVLWSFIKGEQLEFPITLNFVEDVTAGYIYEAKVLEANNTLNQKEIPTDIKANGVIESLTVRIPVKRGTWDSAQAYNKEEVVLYNGTYYKLAKGVARSSSIKPDNDPLWLATNLSIVYVQFPKAFATTWSIAPAITYSVYGFFELRVTEPNDAIFTRTWKPVRGMVEVMYSPTYSSDD